MGIYNTKAGLFINRIENNYLCVIFDFWKYAITIECENQKGS